MAKKETLKLDVKVKGAGDVDDLADSLGDIEDASRKAQGDLDDLLGTVKKLTGEDATVVLAIKAGQVKSEIDDIRVDLATMKSTPAEIEIKIARLAELTGDLDTLTTKIKEVDAAKAEVTVTANTSGAAGNIRSVREEIDKTPRSVGGANSALANMYGNVAGEAGTVLGAIGPVNVAIGQMAEYAADAKFEGEKLGSALGSMAKIAGPVAALSLALSAMSDIIGGIKAEKAFNEEQVKTFTDAIRDGQTAAEALRDVVAETGKLMIVQPTGGGLLGLSEQAEDLIPTFERLGISYEIFMDLVNDPSAAGRYLQMGRDIRETNRDMSEDYYLVADAIGTYQENIGTASDAQQELNSFLDIAPRSAQATLEAFQALEDPISRFPDQWDNIMDALRTGEADTEAAADALEILTEQLNKPPGEIWAMGAAELERRTDAVATAMGEMKDEADADQAALEDLAGAMQTLGAEELEGRTEAVATALEEAAEKTREFEEALRDAGDTIADVRSDLPDLGAELADALDTADATVDFQGAKAGVDDAIEDLQTYIEEHEGIDWSALLDTSQIAPGDIDADMISVVQGVRDALQEGIVAAFEIGGAPAAQHFLDTFVPQLMEQGGLTEAEVYQLLGIPADGSIDAVLQPIIDQAAAARAVDILDAIAGTGVQDPRIAAIQIALERGDITGEIAEIAALLLAEELGIPVTLEGIPPEDVAAAQAYLDGNPVVYRTETDTDVTQQLLDEVADPRTARYESEAPNTPETDAEARPGRRPAHGADHRQRPLHADHEPAAQHRRP